MIFATSRKVISFIVIPQTINRASHSTGACMSNKFDDVAIPLSFREYIVLLATNQATSDIYRGMIKPLGFHKVVDVHTGQKVISAAKRLSPNLVVATSDMYVFSGAQILSAARQDPEVESMPFLIIGAKEDDKPGGMSASVRKFDHAAFIGLPCSSEDFNETVVELMRPFVDPDHEKALELMDQADMAVKQNDLEKAAEYYIQARELDAQNLGAALSLAAVYSVMEKDEEAEDAYLGALELDPYSLVAYFGLAELYERRGDFEHTISVLTQALGLANMLKASKKSISRINFFIGEFELRLERLRNAANSFDTAINMNPNDAVLRSDIGDSYLEKGYMEECEEHYQASLKIDPNQAHIFNRLGIAYRKQKKYAKALKLYDNARAHHPDDEHLLFNAARAHLEANRNLEAAALLEQALEMAPKFRAAQHLLNMAEEGKTWSKTDLEELRDTDSDKLWRREADE